MTGEELRTQRLKLGLTQAALARRLGIARDTLARWERGERGKRSLVNPLIGRGIQEVLEGIEAEQKITT